LSNCGSSPCERPFYDATFGTPKTVAGRRQIPLRLVVEWSAPAKHAKPDALVFGTRPMADNTLVLADLRYSARAVIPDDVEFLTPGVDLSWPFPVTA
jgi:hypothetical protein